MSKDSTILNESQEVPEFIEETLVSSFDLNEFEQYRITDCTVVPNPEPLITINGEVISTPGNITTISGNSKSGKSAFTGILAAGAISDTGCIDGLEGLAVKPNYQGKAVIHIDTEQARHKHKSNLLSILKRANLRNCPDYFLSYNIRQLDLDNYQNTTSGICAAADLKFNGIHLIIIDGIADYIADVNEGKEANAIVKYFEEIAITYNCPLITIVHTNPGGDKERGHLGSQCQRKSESVLTVKHEAGVSYLEPKLLRMAGIGSIPLLQFAYDQEKGYHVGCGEKSQAKEVKGFSFEKVAPDMHLSILRRTFEQKPHLNYRELRAELPVQFKSIGRSKGIFYYSYQVCICSYSS